MEEVKQGTTPKAKYAWTADGAKRRVRDTSGQNGFDYLGSLVYKYVNGVSSLESAAFAGGRIEKASNGYDVNFYVTDHLGSTRVIVDGNGNEKARYDYLPFGESLAVGATSTNRFTFSGKEKQTTGDLSYLDFGARMYDSKIGRWLTQDPLAEKYYSMSSYNYCANNPIKFIDHKGDSISFSYTYDQNKKLTGVTMNVTGKVINVSSNSSIDVNAAAKRISDQLASSFSGKVDGVTFSTNVSLTAVNSMNDVATSDHVFALADMNNGDVNGAANDYGGKVAFVSADYFSGPWDTSVGNMGPRTSGHEFGHLGGLSHVVERYNLMKQGGSGGHTNITGSQLQTIHRAYTSGNLNKGSNYELTPIYGYRGVTYKKMPNRGAISSIVKY